MTLRGIGIGIAAGIAVLGLALAAVGGPGGPVPGQIPGIVGALALLIGVGVAYGWLAHEPTEATPGNREGTDTARVPGAAFDDLVAEATDAAGPAARYRRSRVRRRFRSAAIDVLRHRHGCTEREATRLLRDGEWTDDPGAARFFATGDPETLGDLLPWRGRDRFRDDARRAATEIAAIAGVTGDATADEGVRAARADARDSGGGPDGDSDTVRTGRDDADAGRIGDGDADSGGSVIEAIDRAAGRRRARTAYESTPERTTDDPEVPAGEETGEQAGADRPEGPQ